MTQTLDQLDLPYLEYTNPALAADPYPYFAEARKKHPFLARTDLGVVVTEYQAMRDLFGRDEELRPPYADVVKVLGVENTPWGDFTERQMISLPVETHRFLRDTFAAKFTPRNANELRPLMRATISRLLDQWAPKENIDFEEFASNFPISVMFALVGAPQDGIALLRDDLEVIGLAHSYDMSLFPRIQEGMVRIENYVERIIAERRANPHETQEDLLDLLINTSDDGNVTHRQLADLIVFFFLAGYDTSKNVLTYIMYTLLDHPDIYERCARDHEYCRKVIEEGLRYFNPSTVARFVDKEFTYRDVVFPKDQMMFFPLSISAAIRAPTTNPTASIPTGRSIRRSARLLSRSASICAWASTSPARQLQEAMHQIAQRMRHPRLAGEPGHRPFYGAWGLKGLPITFEEGEAKVFEEA
jgi:cytochrome P450